MSTVGCGLYGRPKWHVIPTQSDNCPTNRSLRAATQFQPIHPIARHTGPLGRP